MSHYSTEVYVCCQELFAFFIFSLSSLSWRHPDSILRIPLAQELEITGRFCFIEDESIRTRGRLYAGSVVLTSSCRNPGNQARDDHLHFAIGIPAIPVWMRFRYNPEQHRAIGWAKGRLYTLIFEVREDRFGEYYHLVTLWRATREEKQLYDADE
jgi:hypothetical protein